jgi:hypothetical protein
VEQQELDYVQHTILPWCTRIEQTINRDLLLPSERGLFYAKHNLSGLMRADTKTRYDGYHLAINDGWMNRNEARSLEELNQKPGLDTFLVPLNTGTVNKDGTINNPNKQQDAPGDVSPTDDVAARLRVIAEASVDRIVRKEVKSKKHDPAYTAQVMAISLEAAQQYCADRDAGKISDAEAATALMKIAMEESDVQVR